MFCSRNANKQINRLHERALRIVYQDYILKFFEELLEKVEKDNYFSTNHQNIQTLAIKMYKVRHGLSKNSFYEIFENSRSCYNLRSQYDLDIPSVSSESYGKTH